MIELNKSNKLPSKVRTYWMSKLLLIIILFSLPFLIYNTSLGTSALWIFLIVIGIPAFISLLLIFDNWSYLLNENKITIFSGVITKRSKAISFDSVQNVDTVSGILRRMFGLATVRIWTASPGQINIKPSNQNGAGDSHRPDGMLILDKENAEWLRDFIVNKK
jgi:uncharacterized membrane protein YdbT with pleckstrin-like domain